MFPLGFKFPHLYSPDPTPRQHRAALPLSISSRLLQCLAIATVLLSLTACVGAVDPSNPQSFVDRGLLRIARGDQPGAIADFTRALEANPKDTKILTLRGIAYANQGKLLDAIKDYDQALSINANLPETLVNRGNVYNQLGDYAQALQDFDRAIALQQDNGVAHSSRGITLFQLGRRQEALEALETAKAIFVKAKNQKNIEIIDKVLADYRRVSP